jgi:hypothetical protein
MSQDKPSKHNQTNHQSRLDLSPNKTPPQSAPKHQPKQKTPPTYPFPDYAIVKDQIFPPQALANIKGTVSGTFVPTPIRSEERVLRLAEAVCQRFVISILARQNPRYFLGVLRKPRG